MADRDLSRHRIMASYVVNMYMCVSLCIHVYLFVICITTPSTSLSRWQIYHDGLRLK